MDWQILTYILPVAAGSITALVYITGKAEERIHIQNRGRGGVYITGAGNLFKFVILPLTILSPLFLFFKGLFATGNLAILKLLAVFLLNTIIYAIVNLGIGGISYINSEIEIEDLSELVFQKLLDSPLRYIAILLINYNILQSIYLTVNLVSTSQHYIISILLFSGTLATYVLTIITFSTLEGVFNRNPIPATVYTAEGKDKGLVISKTDNTLFLGHLEDQDREVTEYNRDSIEKIEYTKDGQKRSSELPDHL